MNYLPVWDSERAVKIARIESLQKLRCKLMKKLIQVHRELEKARNER